MASNRHILIVEDAPEMVILLRQLLEEEGYSVDVAMNGQEALDFLRGKKNLPFLILLDLMMPVMDGFQFRQEQEKDVRLASIPIVIMTADGNIESKELKVGAKGAIKKPMDIKTVIEVVHRFCA
jgi:CheY-like chemotaxis protein